ncbi:hypothetical protein [Rivibacter subsaxonicus]|uniref:Uncharacterized protein n=1 Tax=Rivibacter subsaxonicus TaxID=457575 RepID=A0A4Q7V9C9_9BURK|nr:hypothetical protein [Rivibacter subsaxonicus]RZT91282.1 hypothetical protein EV670_3718 [Rivibacter subsaxonicus]
MKLRRVTTGHSEHGKAVVVSDTEVEGATFPLLSGAGFHRLWGADRPPRFPDAGAPPEYASYFPPLGGFRFMMFTVAPESSPRPPAADRPALLAETQSKLPGQGPVNATGGLA